MDVTMQQLGGTLLSMDSTAQTGSWTLATAGLWQASWWLLTASGPERESFHNSLSGYWTCRDWQENSTSHHQGLLSWRSLSQESRDGHRCSHRAKTLSRVVPCLHMRTPPPPAPPLTHSLQTTAIMDQVVFWKPWNHVARLPERQCWLSLEMEKNIAFLVFPLSAHLQQGHIWFLENQW